MKKRREEKKSKSKIKVESRVARSPAHQCSARIEPEIASEKVRSSANLRTISPIDDENDQSFQDGCKRLRSLLIGRRAWRVRERSGARIARSGVISSSANAPATSSGAARGYLRGGRPGCLPGPRLSAPGCSFTVFQNFKPVSSHLPNRR